MKTFFLFATVLIILYVPNGTAQIISQYVETNSGSVPKGIEIWNNTGSTLDFATNNLVIQQGTNGAALSDIAATTISSGTLASGAVLVIGTSDVGTYLTDQGLTSVTFLVYAFTFNGDDAIAVKYGSTITDYFGQPGTDPGTAWTGGSVSTANQNIAINNGINTGFTNSSGWTDPSVRFSMISSTPATLPAGLSGFGVAPSTTPLPVELTSFTASSVNGTVNLNWSTATEVSNYGFEVERSADKSVWNKIGFVAGNGNSNSVKTYSYSDNTASAGTVYYRLKQLDTDGKYEYSKVVSVNNTTPDAFSVDQNFPNPFNPSTTIRFSLANSSNVKVDVYASNGELVHTLANQTYEAGNHAINFDASQLSAGIYLYRITAIDAAGKTFSAVKKMQLIK